MLDLNSIIITVIVTLTPLIVQIELNKRSIKSDLTMKIKSAVARDARERAKIYKKLCQLDQKVDKFLAK